MGKHADRRKKTYLLYGAVTLAVLAVLFILFLYLKSQVAPVYEYTVKGLSAETPAQAQTECRADYKKFASVMKDYEDCSWVWCGKDVLYLVRPSALKVDVSSDETNFTAVKFFDSHGNRLRGYIIDPSIAPKELGRIILSPSDEYTFDNVSMTVRVGIRNGEIKYDDAVFLWEKGSAEVIVVRPDTYETVQDNIVSFTDDGNVVRICYVLDTVV